MANSPFRVLFQLADGGKILKWMVRKPELVHQMCQMILEYIVKMAKMYADEFGTEGWRAMFTYPTESHGLLSPKQFQAFSAPYAKMLHQELKKIGFVRFMEHPCGDHRHNLWFWKDELELPEHTTLSFGKEIPLHEISKYFGKRFVIGGNVDTTKLAIGAADEVYNETKDIVLKMKDREGGYVLMAACAITNAVPPANIMAMIQAVEDYGYYE